MGIIVSNETEFLIQFSQNVTKNNLITGRKYVTARVNWYILYWYFGMYSFVSEKSNVYRRVLIKK